MEHEGTSRAETDLDQVVVTTAVKHIKLHGEQEPGTQIIAPGGGAANVQWAQALVTVIEDCVCMPQTVLGQKGKWPGSTTWCCLLKKGPWPQAAVAGVSSSTWLLQVSSAGMKEAGGKLVP